jgi:hypothetical protein
MRRNPKRNEKDASRTTGAGSGNYAGDSSLWRTRRADALAQRVPPRALVPVLRFSLHSDEGQLMLSHGIVRDTSALAADVIYASSFRHDHARKCLARSASVKDMDKPFANRN